MRAALVLALFTACATTSDDVTTTRHPSGAVSWTSPDGWTKQSSTTTDVELVSETTPRATLIVRVVPRTGNEGRADDKTVFDATLAVNANLACFHERSRDTSRRAATRPVLVEQYDFCPPSGGAYQRTHAVIAGKTQIIHIIQTAPTGHVPGGAAVDAVLASLKELA